MNLRNELQAFLHGNFSRPAPAAPAVKPRIEFIDLAKGVCIMLVLWIHARMDSVCFDLPVLRTARMPLYFLLSGLFFKDYGSLYNLFERKLNRLLIPFIFFSFIGLPGVWFMDRAISWDMLIRPFTDPKGGFNIVVWFLICLFWVNILFGVISLTFKREVVRALMVLACGAAGWQLSLHEVFLPMHLSQALSAMPFFYAGFLLKKTSILYPSPRLDRYSLPAGLAVMVALGLLYATLGSPGIEFLTHIYTGHPLLILPVALLMVLALLMVCKRLRWLPVLSYIGRYSIVVLGLHWIYLDWSFRLYHFFTGHDPDDSMMVARFVLTVVLCWVSIPLFTRLFPSLTAQRDCVLLPRKKGVATNA